MKPITLNFIAKKIVKNQEHRDTYSIVEGYVKYLKDPMLLAYLIRQVNREKARLKSERTLKFFNKFMGPV